MAKLKTGRHTSALKAARQAERRAERNRAIESKIKNIAKKVREAVAKKDKKAAQELLVAAFSEWDKASRKKLIHTNTAANKKSRLAKLVSSIQG
jgi:ribosomal protein S20